MRKPYSNLFFYPSVSLSTIACNAIAQKKIQPRELILHTWMEDQLRKTPIDKFKNQVKSDIVFANLN